MKTPTRKQRNVIAFNLPDNILKADLFNVHGWEDQNKKKTTSHRKSVVLFFPSPLFRADIALSF